MRRLLFLFLTIFLGMTIYTLFDKNLSEGKFKSTIEAKSIYVVDLESKKVLYQKNEDLPVPIASMTKLMTQYIVLNAVANEKVNWQTLYSPSEAVLSIANKQGYANLKMKRNAQYTVEDLFTASTVISANDATIALAEIIAGTEENFVRIMNEQADYFGLKNTVFFNATGLDGSYVGESNNETNKSSAHDVAVIAEKILDKHKIIVDFTSIPKMTTDAGIKYNTNLTLPGGAYEIPGIDGLKTGYTEEAQLCFVGTGVFNGRRIITVVTGVSTGTESDGRFELTKELIDEFAIK